MPSDNNITQPHSIWLCCDGDEHAALQDEIARLTRFSETPVFFPHMTLVGDFNGKPADTDEICAPVSMAAKPLTLEVGGVSTTDQYFMSLFLDLVSDIRLSQLRAKLFDGLNLPKAAPFRPHISLAYGFGPHDLPDDHAVYLRNTFSGRLFSLSRLVVAASSSTMQISDWRVLSEYRLKGVV